MWISSLSAFSVNGASFYRQCLIQKMRSDDRFLLARYNVSWHRLRGLNHPLRIGDVLVLPITAFSPFGEADFHSEGMDSPQADVVHNCEWDLNLILMRFTSASIYSDSFLDHCLIWNILPKPDLCMIPNANLQFEAVGSLMARDKFFSSFRSFIGCNTFFRTSLRSDSPGEASFDSHAQENALVWDDAQQDQNRHPPFPTECSSPNSFISSIVPLIFGVTLTIPAAMSFYCE